MQHAQQHGPGAYQQSDDRSAFNPQTIVNTTMNPSEQRQAQLAGSQLHRSSSCLNTHQHAGGLHAANLPAGRAAQQCYQYSHHQQRCALPPWHSLQQDQPQQHMQPWPMHYQHQPQQIPPNTQQSAVQMQQQAYQQHQPYDAWSSHHQQMPQQQQQQLHCDPHVQHHLHDRQQRHQQPQQQLQQHRQVPVQQGWQHPCRSQAALIPQLGDDQERAVAAVLQGHCVFLTGGAGVGKSFTVNSIVQQLREAGKTVAVTASTGTAAVALGGMTLHSWAGVLDPNRPVVQLAEGLWCWRKFRDVWQNTDVLLVDEISMVAADMMEKIDYLARYLRGWRIQQHNHPELRQQGVVHELHPEPFGGMQVISVGDFFQLPPVDRAEKTVAGSSGTSTSPASAAAAASGGSGGPSPLGSAAAAVSGGAVAAGASGGSISRGRKRRIAAFGGDDDDTGPPKHCVIMAVLPPGVKVADIAEAAAAAAGDAAGNSQQQQQHGLPASINLETSSSQAVAGDCSEQCAVACAASGVNHQQQQSLEQQQQQQADVRVKPEPLSQQQQADAGVKSEPLSQQRQQAVPVKREPSSQQELHQSFPAQPAVYGSSSIGCPSLGQLLLMQPRTRFDQAAADGDGGGSLAAAGVGAASQADSEHQLQSPAAAAAAAEAMDSEDEWAAADHAITMAESARKAARVKQEEQQQQIMPNGLQDGLFGLMIAGPAAAAAPAAVIVPTARGRLPAGSVVLDTSPFSFNQPSTCTLNMNSSAHANTVVATSSAPPATLTPPGNPTGLAGHNSSSSGRSAAAADAGSGGGSSQAATDSRRVRARGSLAARRQVEGAVRSSQAQAWQQDSSGREWGNLRSGEPVSLTGRFDFRRIVNAQVYEDHSRKAAAAAAAGGGGGDGCGGGAGSGSGTAGGSGGAEQHTYKSAQLSAASGRSVADDIKVAPVGSQGLALGGGSSSSLGINWVRGIKPKGYCFKSPAWAAADFKPVILKQPFRQNEPELLNMLDEVRQGGFSSTTQALLHSLKRPLPEEDGITPTELYATNREVDCHNSDMYARLPGPELLTRALDEGWSAEGQELPQQMATEELNAAVNVQSTLKMKPQAQVVLLSNLAVDAGLANGTRGVVEGLADIRDYLRQEGVVVKGVVADSCHRCSSSLNSAGTQATGYTSSNISSAEQQQFWHHSQHAKCANCAEGGTCGDASCCALWCEEQQQQQQHTQQHSQAQLPVSPHTTAAAAAAAVTGNTPVKQPGQQTMPRFNEQLHQAQAQAHGPPPASYCGQPHCPCGMIDWGRLGAAASQPLCVRLPDAPDGVLLDISGVLPYKRPQLQNAVVWLNHTSTLQLPRVRFSAPPKVLRLDPQTPGPRLIVGPQTWTHRARAGWDPSVKLTFTRTAVPLRLAWALTIHRSQGMSITKLRVHLNQAFAAGMVYVALSRCVSLDSLQVVGWKAPMADVDVKMLYDFLQQHEWRD